MATAIQTKQDMIKNYEATEEEANKAMELWSLLNPCVKVQKNGRVQTMNGDFTPLGLYRAVKNIVGGK